MRICSDLGLPEAQEYATKLKKAEKTKELREQVCSYCPLYMSVIVSKHYLNQCLRQGYQSLILDIICLCLFNLTVNKIVKNEM